jgi:hypothetical protein
MHMLPWRGLIPASREAIAGGPVSEPGQADRTQNVSRRRG